MLCSKVECQVRFGQNNTIMSAFFDFIGVDNELLQLLPTKEAELSDDFTARWRGSSGASDSKKKKKKNLFVK